ncbi:hypothetical protein [Paractinoplanes durhamensis]|uniref:Uncharacterized protein n=1 Tax=Paractinoplanes durhamensis TaxID=113563 RepID=A0ABQ3Z530_9ACTN|nr:hypothetical protein Adu01nite_62900 [Actinoplanes durhamensis]
MVDAPAPAVEYLETADFEWTERAFALLERNAIVITPHFVDGIISIVISGSCPRCSHETVERFVDTVITGVDVKRGPADGGDPGDVLEVDVTCRCGVPHDHAPENVAGCGVSFRIALEDS